MRPFRSCRSISILVLCAITGPVQAQLWERVVKTEYGPVQGFEYFNQSTLKQYFNASESSVTAFLGIPYGADTAYQNRWKPAQPPTPWNETLNASAFGPSCPTAYVDNYSEDCLSLNLWTPSKNGSDKFPVLVWNQGSDEGSNDPRWYGGGFAMNGVVTISFNRRDDVFGYLAHPELNAEGLAATGHNTSGTYGVLDQLEVLKWVQKNIANFGGDPNRVTVAGQSFGSSQVYHAVNSPLFTGYFHGGIAQSGIRYPFDTLVAGLATSYVTMPNAIRYGLNYTASHNVSTIEELRTLPLESLMIGSTDRLDASEYPWYTALSTAYPLIFKPVLDGYVLPEKYIESLLNGPANDVPVITGNTKDESGAATTTNLTVEEYEYDCTAKYGNLSSQYFKLWPGNNDTQADASWNAAATHTSLVSTWAYAQDWIKSANSSIWTYYWDHAPPGQTEGAYHQSDITYTLNSLYATAYEFPYVAYDYYLGDRLSSYWANFAKTGDPNLGGSHTNGTLPYWGPTNTSDQVVFNIGDSLGELQAIARSDEVTFILDYFSQQVPF